RASWSNDAAGLPQRTNPIRPLRQVVQRTQQQHRIDGRVVEVQAPRVADGGVDRCTGDVCITYLFDVQRDEIAMVDTMTEVGEPGGVPAGSATDVGDDRGWR